MIRTMLAGIFALVASLPVMASPEGVWEIEMRDSRYNVTLCGDGTQICGELIWLGNGADNAENLPYMNTLVIDHARPTGPNRWRGELNIYGQRASGTITQISADEIRLQGCVALILCRTYTLYRYAGD